MTVPVIDLGLVGVATIEWPARARTRRRSRRWWLAPLLAVLVPLAAGPGEAALGPSPFEALFTTDFMNTFRLTADGLYGVAIDGSALVAYTRNGAVLWSAPLTLTARRADVRLDTVAGLVLVSHRTVLAQSAQTAVIVSAYSSTTGDLRWQVPGSVVAVAAGGGRVLVRHQPPAVDAERSPPPSEFSAVEPGTGTVV